MHFLSRRVCGSSIKWLLSSKGGQSFSTSALRSSGHIEQHGIPGANLPFDINNRHKLLAVFILYFGSGLTAPFLLVRHQLLKD